MVQLERKRAAAPFGQAALFAARMLQTVVDETQFQVVPAAFAAAREEGCLGGSTRPRVDVAALDGIAPCGAREPVLDLALPHRVPCLVKATDRGPVIPARELAVGIDTEAPL